MSDVSSLSPSLPVPHVRRIGAVNWLGLWVLITKETLRFLKVYAQTIIAPVVTTILFYLIFSISLGGGHHAAVEGVPYLAFLAPGLIMMSTAQNAFANSSSSLVISKVQGNIVDILMPPLSPLEFTLGYVVGGVARGVIVGVVSVAALTFITDISITNIGYIFYHGIMGSMMLALLGVVGGIWSEKFDHLAAVQNFIVMPATFLSGTFYRLDQLPETWRFICHLNPFFYMIDGFRYGFVGLSDGTLGVGLLVVAACNILLFIVAHQMVARGYKLKS